MQTHHTQSVPSPQNSHIIAMWFMPRHRTNPIQSVTIFPPPAPNTFRRVFNAFSPSLDVSIWLNRRDDSRAPHNHNKSGAIDIIFSIMAPWTPPRMDRLTCIFSYFLRFGCLLNRRRLCDWLEISHKPFELKSESIRNMIFKQILGCHLLEFMISVHLHALGFVCYWCLCWCLFLFDTFDRKYNKLIVVAQLISWALRAVATFGFSYIGCGYRDTCFMIWVFLYKWGAERGDALDSFKHTLSV